MVIFKCPLQSLFSFVSDRQYHLTSKLNTIFLIYKDKIVFRHRTNKNYDKIVNFI